MANDRRSISESISSERTTSSCDININYPRINSIGLLPVGDGSRSSGEMISDGTLASQILSMESFRNQQVSRQAHQDYSRLLLVIIASDFIITYLIIVIRHPVQIQNIFPILSRVTLPLLPSVQLSKDRVMQVDIYPRSYSL